MLDGLWAAGVDIHPVFGDYPDYIFTNSQQYKDQNRNIQYAYNFYNSYNRSRDDLIGFVTAQLRRFKPMVVVTHDFAGEYGHSQHMVCADIMAEAVTVSNDPAQYPELTEIYGLWDVPKTYIHLYEENPIVIDLDTPLESFGGKTAFEVSKYLAFPKHASQYNDVCYHINPFKTAAAMRYSPCNYGLLRSTVGGRCAKE